MKKNILCSPLASRINPFNTKKLLFPQKKKSERSNYFNSSYFADDLGIEISNKYSSSRR